MFVHFFSHKGLIKELVLNNQWKELINTVICGNARKVLSRFPDGVFQAIITSPPWWSQNNAQGSPYETQGSMKNIYVSRGWQPGCKCADNDGSGKAVVLDPFCGAGTVAVVALELGRQYLGIDNNAEYVRMAQKRIAETQPGLPL